jgi:hypothetical protein
MLIKSKPKGPFLTHHIEEPTNPKILPEEPTGTILMPELLGLCTLDHLLSHRTIVHFSVHMSGRRGQQIWRVIRSIFLPYQAILSTFHIQYKNTFCEKVTRAGREKVEEKKCVLYNGSINVSIFYISNEYCIKATGNI